MPRKEEKTDYYGRREQIEHPTRTLVHMGEETIAVGLAEETEFTHPPAKRPPPDADYKVYWAWRKTPLPPRRASGALTLSMKDVSDVGRKSWTDRKPKRLEDSLNTFVAALVRAAGVLQQRRREREEHERRWKERQEQLAREEQARKELAERIERLDKQLASWRTARDIRAFVEEARGLFGDGAGPPTQERDDYLKWALKRADDLDEFAPIRWTG